MLYRPLFFTSFMLADQLEDNGFFGAEALLLSSASSKTAYGTAFLLKGKGPAIIGITSPQNVAFAQSLGCYDEVVSYDAVRELASDRPTGYLDLAGSASVRASVREHFGSQLVHETIVGVTHQEPAGSEALAGPRTEVFFAPDQMRKRSAEWGRDELDRRFGEAWRAFAPMVEGWVDVVERHGPDGLREVWLEVLSGRSRPRDGNVLRL